MRNPRSYTDTPNQAVYLLAYGAAMVLLSIGTLALIKCQLSSTSSISPPSADKRAVSTISPISMLDFCLSDVSQPSKYRGWCRLDDHIVMNDIFFPETWSVDQISANGAIVTFNMDGSSALKPKVIFINTNTGFPLEEADKAIDGIASMGQDGPVLYVGKDEVVIKRNEETIGQHKTLHLTTRNEDQIIERYFIKQAGGNDTLYLFEVYLKQKEFRNGDYESEGTVRKMVSLVEFL